MKSVSATSGVALYFLFVSCWAEPVAQASYHDPVRRGGSDAYNSCLETFDNSEIPPDFIHTFCSTLGDTIPILKTSAYCGMARNFLERCYESTGDVDHHDRGRYEEQPYNNRQEGYYDQEPYNEDGYYREPYNGQTPNGQPYDGDPYNGRQPNDNPRVRNY